MRRIWLIPALLAALPGAAAWTQVLPAPLILEDFKKGNLGKFPEKWQGRDPGAEAIYRLAEEGGGRYLSAEDPAKSIQIFRRVEWEVEKFPRLRWRWRARIFPAGAVENAPGKNDSACGVYVVFPRNWTFIPRVIKYIWSETVPAGTSWPGSGKTWVVVKSSGKEKAGQWVEAEAAVADDFRRLFKMDQAQSPVAIGLLTDANDTHSRAACDYARFEALPAAASTPRPLPEPTTSAATSATAR